jgi:hypothetical protein
VFGGALTYVPGFWSWKGLVSTVWTLMIAVICVCVKREDEGGAGGREL